MEHSFKEDFGMGIGCRWAFGGMSLSIVHPNLPYQILMIPTKWWNRHKIVLVIIQMIHENQPKHKNRPEKKRASPLFLRRPLFSCRHGGEMEPSWWTTARPGKGWFSNAGFVNGIATPGDSSRDLSSPWAVISSPLLVGLFFGDEIYTQLYSGIVS